MTAQAAALTPDTLLEALNWRYATKVFDPSRSIPEAEWKALEESLVLTPSSYGLQPYRFVVVEDPALREALRPVSWGQSQITDASKLMVFAAREDMTEADVDRLIQRTVQVRGVAAEALEGYRGMMLGDLVNGPRRAWAHHWAARQAYLAFGQVMANAALLGIDACPLEGIDPARYDALLGLEGRGYRTVAACAFGYRSSEDRYGQMAKVRFTADELILRR